LFFQEHLINCAEKKKKKEEEEEEEEARYFKELGYVSKAINTCMLAV